MKNIVDKHYSKLNLNTQGRINCDLIDWYRTYDTYGPCNDLSYQAQAFVRVVNTQLYINIKWRLSRGLHVCGKEA